MYRIFIRLLGLHKDNFTRNNLKAIVEKNILFIYNKKPNMCTVFKQYHTIKNYRKGLLIFYRKIIYYHYINFLFHFYYHPYNQ